MNRKTREGKAKQRAGSVSEALGKLLGSSELQQSGAKQAHAGEAQAGRGRVEAVAPKRQRSTRE